MPVDSGMHDLEIATENMKNKGLTLSIAKNGKIMFETASHGISGFLEAIEKLGSKLEGASVSDSVVGKAIALLCVNALIKAVYAVTLSREAESVLEKYSIYHKWNHLVDSILDVHRKGMCPFEKLANEISSPKDAYVKFKTLQNSLRCNG